MTTIILWIVDDDEDDRFLLGRAVQQLNLNYQLSFFEDGDTLLDYVTNSSQLPDLIVMDYNLPSMNALELTEQLRAVAGFETVPIEWMSSQVDLSWQQPGTSLSVRMYWPKPDTYQAWQAFAEQLGGLQSL